MHGILLFRLPSDVGSCQSLNVKKRFTIIDVTICNSSLPADSLLSS
jgi:hypothetical protein